MLSETFKARQSCDQTMGMIALTATFAAPELYDQPLG
jgi:hypothetical protein